MNNPTRRTVLFFAVFLIFSMAFASAFDLGDWMRGLFSGKSLTGKVVDGVSTDGLVANYNFSDSSVSSSGTLSSGAYFANEGIDGKALSLNGNGQYSSVSNVNLDANVITYGFWFKTRDAYNVRRIVEHSWDTGGVFTSHIYYGNVVGGLQFRDGTSKQLATTNRISADTWNHLVVNYDGNTMKLYLNGQEAGSAVVGKELKTASKTLYMGGVSGVSFNGSIDEVFVYKRALSADEIKKIYDAEKGRLVSTSGGGGGGTISYSLTVSVAGADKGSVASDPVGIGCGSDCTESYKSGASVKLTATPKAGAKFVEWTGACSGTATTCTVTINENKNVGARFDSAIGGTAECKDGRQLDIDEGQSKTVTYSIHGAIEKSLTYNIRLLDISNSHMATIEVNGIQKIVELGNSYEFKGDQSGLFLSNLSLYVNDIFYATKTGTKGSIQLFVLGFVDGGGIPEGKCDSQLDIDEGQMKEAVSLSGNIYKVKLLGTTSTTAAKISVDGAVKDVQLGSSYEFIKPTFSGYGVKIILYVNDIFHATKTGTLSRIQLLNLREILLALQCTDSDGGKDYYKNGTVKGTDGKESKDYCVDSKKLVEYSCPAAGSTIQAIGEVYECPNGCSDGICLRSTTAPSEELSLSIATLKNYYESGEKIELTDPPEGEIESGSLSVDAWLGDSRAEQEVDQQKFVRIQGYLVELKDRPIIENELAIKQKLSEVKREYVYHARKAEEGSPILKPFRLQKANSLKNQYNEIVASSTDERKKKYENIRAKHEQVKESIKNLLDRNQKGSISAKAVFDYESQPLSEDTLVKEYSYIFNGFVYNVSKEEAEKIAQLSDVKAVYPNYEVKVSLDSSIPAMNLDKVRKDFNLTGEGVTIAIIDTGIDASHESLDDLDDNPETQDAKVIGFMDYINFRKEPYDDNGHGTHVSGIAAGTGGGDDSKYIGVAPKAKLVGVKVLNGWGSGTFDGVLSGIEWTIQNKERYNISIISMSLGANVNSDGSTPMERAVDYAVAQGINVVVAAGNAGRRGNNSVGIPASAFNVTAVGAVDDNLKIAQFSSRGPTKDGRIKPEVSAVGVDVMSSIPGGGYHELSGTSMATPHVSGFIALLLQQNPSLNSKQIRDLLMKTAIDKGEPGPDNEYGYGVIEGLSTFFSINQPEHEVSILDFDVGKYILVGQESIFTAKIKNYGKNAESFNLKLSINGGEKENKEINLMSGEEREMKFMFKPDKEGNYDVSIEIPYINGETYFTNNKVSKELKAVAAIGKVKAVVVDSWGNHYAWATIFDDLNSQWFKYGKYLVNIDYTTLKKEEISYEDLVASGADVLIISNAWANGEIGMQTNFKDSEIAAIKRYVEEGHGLIGTGGTLSELVTNNIKLAELFGIKSKSGIWNTQDAELEGQMKLLTDDPILTKNIPSSFVPGLAHTLIETDIDLTKNVVKVAKGEKQDDVYVSAYKPLNGTSVYFTYLPELMYANEIDRQFFYNSILWASRSVGASEHDIAISDLKYSSRIPLGNSLNVSVGVKNLGKSQESNVGVVLKINGKTQESKKIDFRIGEIKEASFSVPSLESGVYEFSIEVSPISGEKFVVNNKIQGSFIIQAAVLNNKNNDQLIDIDKDGKYDFINVSFGVNVHAEGYYRIIFDVTSFLGVKFGEYSSGEPVYLNKGENSISALVYLPSIKKLELNGPYKIKNIRLLGSVANAKEQPTKSTTEQPIKEEFVYKDDKDDFLLYDINEPGFNTKTYRFSSFEDSSSINKDQIFSYGLDNDKDKLYDSLVVKIPVIINLPGFYTLYGGLEVPQGFLLYSEESSYLNVTSPGGYVMNLTFDGVELRKFKASGNFVLREVILRSSNIPTVTEDAREDYIDEFALKEKYEYKQFETFTNLRVDSVNFDSPYHRLIKEENNKLIVNLFNDGSEEIGAFDVSLRDFRNVILQTKRVEGILPDSIKNVVFTYVPKEVGELRLNFSAELKDEEQEDNVYEFTGLVMDKGADLRIYLNDYGNQDFVIGTASYINFSIYNEGTEKAKDVRVELYAISYKLDADGKGKEERKLISTKDLGSLDIYNNINDRISYTPTSRWNNLVILVNSSNERIPQDNVFGFSVSAIPKNDLELRYDYGEHIYFVAGSSIKVNVSIVNLGAEKAEDIKVNLYEVTTSYEGGKYTEKKNLISSREISSLNYKSSIDVTFSYIPSESRIGQYVSLLIEVDEKEDSYLDNNRVSIGGVVLPQSKLVNRGLGNVAGLLNISIHQYENDIWKATNIKGILNYPVTLKPKELMKLDKLFNPLNINLLQSGRYRVYAEFVSKSGKKLEQSWNFEISGQTLPPPSDGGDGKPPEEQPPPARRPPRTVPP